MILLVAILVLALLAAVMKISEVENEKQIAENYAREVENELRYVTEEYAKLQERVEYRPPESMFFGTSPETRS